LISNLLNEHLALLYRKFEKGFALTLQLKFNKVCNTLAEK